MAKKKNSEVQLDIDKIVEEARGNFKNKEKGLGLQMMMGSEISRPTEDHEFVCWKASHWEALTGMKGIPFGRIVQIAGRPDSGKTSHAMAFMKRAQDQNVFVIFWDVESKFSATRYEKYFGGDASTLFMVTSKLILEGADMVLSWIDAIKKQDPLAKILIVWDSVGGTVAKGEGDKVLRASNQMAEASKDNGKALRAFIRKMEEYKDKETNEENIAVLLVNQTYANINSPGQKESGGQKVEYFSSLILQLTRKGDANKQRKGIKRRVGIITRAKVKKNHLFDGEDTIAELDLLITAGEITLAPASAEAIKKAGEWPEWDVKDPADVIDSAPDAPEEAEEKGGK